MNALKRAQKHKNPNYHFLNQYSLKFLKMCVCPLCVMFHAHNTPPMNRICTSNAKIHDVKRTDHYCMVTSQINELLKT